MNWFFSQLKLYIWYLILNVLDRRRTDHPVSSLDHTKVNRNPPYIILYGDYNIIVSSHTYILKHKESFSVPKVYPTSLWLPKISRIPDVTTVASEKKFSLNMGTIHHNHKWLCHIINNLKSINIHNLHGKIIHKDF